MSLSRRGVGVYVCDGGKKKNYLAEVTFSALSQPVSGSLPKKILRYPQHIMWCGTDGLCVCFHLYSLTCQNNNLFCFVFLAPNVLSWDVHVPLFISARTPSLTYFYAKSQDIPSSFYYEEMSERNVSMCVARRMLMWHVTCYVFVSERELSSLTCFI